MTKRSDTWMPLYIGDYLADTSRLTTEQHGAYLLLLMDYWRNGPPPDDEDTLAAIAKLPVSAWRKCAPRLRLFFAIEDGQWHQKRMDAEREKAAGIGGKRKAAGAAGAAKRWGKGDGKPIANAMANGMANASQSDACAGTPSPSPSPIHTEYYPDPSAGAPEDSADPPPAELHDVDPASLAEGHQPTAAGALCRSLRQAGVSDTNPGHPRLLALLQAGASPPEFLGFAKAAAGMDRPFAWLLGAVEGERKRAARGAPALHRGAMPNRQEAIEQRNRAVADEWLRDPHRESPDA
jgi:uncharacterized protein YdaU (DUF1376 family)